MTPPDDPAEPTDADPVAAGAATPDRVDALAAELRERGVPFARATVVRQEPPVSAHVGDRAVVTGDGEVVGWIGGVECAQAGVVEAATRALRTGEPVLLGLAPDPDDVARPGLEAREMTCHGGGTLEVFVEPVGVRPALLVVGNSAVASALVGLAAAVGFRVTVVDPDGGSFDGADRVIAETDPEGVVEAADPGSLVVVASMGAYDERGVAAGIRLGAPYVGLVASAARAGAVCDRAAEMLDADPAAVREAVTGPAGVDIAAEAPAEIAASVLAELIDVRRSGDGAPAAGPGVAVEPTDRAAEPAGTATDPVCGMDVSLEDPPATVEHGGETYVFCCAGCADAFAADPASYLEGSTA